MSQYEGLNLPQLMDLLHGPVVPEVVPMTPQTVGWLVLFGGVAVVLVIAATHAVLRYRKNRYRREALAQLMTVSESVAPDQQGAEIATILKRVAIVTFGRDAVASLYGEAWGRFMAETVDHDPLIEPHALTLASIAYCTDADTSALFAPARRWIERHHD